MLLYPTNMHFHFVHKQIVDGCGWYDQPIKKLNDLGLWSKNAQN